MKNFTILENNHLQTPFGIFGGLTSYHCYPEGELEGISLSERNMLVTHAGELIPFYTETPRRKNKYAVEYHKNGMIKAVALEEQQEVITPIGELPAEMVMFYDTGELCRIFPLDGKISGFWSEEDERQLHFPLSFDLGFAAFSARIGCVAFYKNGEIRSITLFPGEVIPVHTEKYGEIPTRTGFSLYENGMLASLEPAVPLSVQTPIGKLTAYNPNANGITADSNSLALGEDGEVVSLQTVSECVVVTYPDGRTHWISPREIPHPLEEDTTLTEEMPIAFDYKTGTVTIGREGPFSLAAHTFSIVPYKGYESGTCSPAKCASCSLCQHKPL